MSNLVEELKRRNVIRVGTVYIRELVGGAIRSSLRKSIATGLYTTAGFYSAHFNPYRDDARFKALEREAIRRANQERRKLGMLET